MFTTHTLVAEKKGTRCTTCHQTWTSWRVRSDCPGVRVYLFEELPSSLKTLTALERERKYPPDPQRWDGAYRILKAPYYRLVYDETQAIHKPLTQKQQQTVEKQRRTMREKYGCRLCDIYYRKEDQHSFKNRVCLRCRNAAESWNGLIEWARHMIREDALILDITTAPTERPVDWIGRAPSIYSDAASNTHLIEWWKPSTFLLTGYGVLRLTDGEVIHQTDHLKNLEDLTTLRRLIIPQPSALLPYPLVLMTTRAAAQIAYRAVAAHEQEGNPNLEILPLSYAFSARTGHRWTDILQIDRGYTEREHLEQAALTCGLLPNAGESIASLLHRFVRHLAEQPIIHVEDEGDPHE